MEPLHILAATVLTLLAGIAEISPGNDYACTAITSESACVDSPQCDTVTFSGKTSCSVSCDAGLSRTQCDALEYCSWEANECGYPEAVPGC